MAAGDRDVAGGWPARGAKSRTAAPDLDTAQVEVLSDEEHQIACLTVYAESDRELPVLGKIMEVWMIGLLLTAIPDRAGPALRALTQSPAAILDAEMGDCQKDNELIGSEIWRNHTEKVWFIKSTVCPGAGVLRPARDLAEQWAVRHWQSTHQ